MTKPKPVDLTDRSSFTVVIFPFLYSTLELNNNIVPAIKSIIPSL